MSGISAWLSGPARPRTMRSSRQTRYPPTASTQSRKRPLGPAASTRASGLGGKDARCATGGPGHDRRSTAQVLERIVERKPPPDLTAEFSQTIPSGSGLDRISRITCQNRPHLSSQPARHGHPAGATGTRLLDRSLQFAARPAIRACRAAGCSGTLMRTASAAARICGHFPSESATYRASTLGAAAFWRFSSSVFAGATACWAAIAPAPVGEPLGPVKLLVRPAKFAAPALGQRRLARPRRSRASAATTDH